MPARSTATTPAPVQTFKPTGGRLVGYAGLGAAALFVVGLAVEEPNLVGLRFALGLLLVAVVIWMALLRPRVAAYEETLLLRGILRDTQVPLARIEAAIVRSMLTVWVGDERFTSPAIGRPTRKLLKHQGRGPMAVLGVAQTDEAPGAAHGADVGNGKDYATFVETRIEDLARAARRDLRGDPPPVRHAWATRELGALGVLALALALSLLV